MSEIQIATKPTSPIEQFRGDMKRMESEFRMVLPAQISADKFVRTTLTAVAMNKDLLQADRQSLMSSTMKAAQDGLLCDGREAALIIFKTKEKDGTYVQKVQYMPMMSGLLKKMRNSGQIASISTSVVYEKDEFSYIKGDNERIEHKPFLDGEPGTLKFAYAIAVLKDGSVQREVMTRAQIEKVKAVSKTKDFGPWATWYDAMARKTVLRQLYKYLPASAEVEQLIEHDNETYESDMQDVTPEPATKVDAIKEKLRRTKKISAPAEESKSESELKTVEEIKTSEFDWDEWGKGFLKALKACTSLDDLEALKTRHTNKLLECAETKKDAFSVIEKNIEKAIKNLTPSEEPA